MQLTYHFSLENAQQHLIGIRIEFTNKKTSDVAFKLPLWRPGRYERANYPANIRDLSASVEEHGEVEVLKTDSHTWLLKDCPEGVVELSYNYFANTINAGSSYIDEEQLYVNPVNCCMHRAKAMKDKVEAILHIPKEYKYSGMLPMKNTRIKAKSLDEWYDSPFVCSEGLIQHRFEEKGVAFEIAVQGDVPYEKKQIESDFKKFILTQVKAFGDLPVNRYTFLIQATPHRYYHGVEHEQGTTIALGPSRKLLKGSIYSDLLAVSSHELYHTWNVKYMRPEDMWPYDFDQENYHRVGHIIEGVTTYQGDLKLWQAGVMSNETFLKEIKTHLDRHVINFGRFNLSLRQSSFDTWVDGYGASIPDRKVSIYTEGALLSMIYDMAIMLASKGSKSLDQVMRQLYEQCKEKGRGYSEEDYRAYIRERIGEEAEALFSSMADDAIAYEPILYPLFKDMGLVVKKVPINNLASRYGIIVDQSEQPKVLSVHPESQAYEIGIRVGMRIIGVDGLVVEGDLDDLMYREELNLILREGKSLHMKELEPSDDMLYYQHALSFNSSKNALWRKWKKGIF